MPPTLIIFYARSTSDEKTTAYKSVMQQYEQWRQEHPSARIVYPPSINQTGGKNRGNEYMLETWTEYSITLFYEDIFL